MGASGKGAWVECRRVAGRPECEALCLAVAGDPSRALNPVEAFEALRVEREEWEAKQIRLGADGLGRGPFNLRLASCLSAVD